MAQRDIELILVRQLAETISLPVIVVDAENDLVFFNESAGAVLGRAFDEVDALPADERIRVFDFRDEHGQPVAADDLPLVIATREQRPSHARLWAHGLDGVVRLIEVTAFPLTASGGHHVGAVAIFWQDQAE